MEDLLDNNQVEVHLSDKEIFTKIWTAPRRVFKFINDNNYDRFVTLLLVLSGISWSFDRASLRNMGDKMSIWSIIGLCIVAGGLFGWVSYYIYAGLMNWTGKWLKAKGNTGSILRMLSYAMLPSIIALAFLIPQIIIYRNEVFKSDGDISSAGLVSNSFVYGSMLLEFVLGVWTIVLCIIGTSEVQKLSIGKSILNLLLPLIVILLPLLAIIFIFKTIN